MIKAYIAFMDHSITEQLTGDPGAWHTTAIVLSEGGEVSDLARRVSQGIFRSNPRLRKWSTGRGAGKRRYRAAFSQELACHLPRGGVYLLATSATEEAIVGARNQVIRELGIADMCQERHGPRGTPLLSVGPFVHPDTGPDHYFTLPLNRALMVIWVSHFVARMHRMFRSQLQTGESNAVVLDWFFYLDKFAGDSPDASVSTAFFQTLVSGNIADGNVRSGFFIESDTVDADLLADNVAGLLNHSRVSPSGYPRLPELLRSGSIYYELQSPGMEC